MIKISLNPYENIFSRNKVYPHITPATHLSHGITHHVHLNPPERFKRTCIYTPYHVQHQKDFVNKLKLVQYLKISTCFPKRKIA